MAAIEIFFEINDELKKSGLAALCRAFFRSAGTMVSIEPFTPQIIELPDRVFFDDRGVDIRFFVGFVAETKKLDTEISALARVRQPRRITLSQDTQWHIAGTIISEQFRSLGASAIKHGCDLHCEPPASEGTGPSGCVVCKLRRGVFELCC